MLDIVNVDEFRPVIMWFWNDTIDEKGITFQVERFKEEHILQFFIHPMYGMQVKYLSEEYFRLVKFAVQEAKRLGMKFWIYDEYNWPSGTAGGFLIKEEPWTRSSVLRVVRLAAIPGQKIEVYIPGQFLCAHAVYNDNNHNEFYDTGYGHKASATYVKDITAFVKETEKSIIHKNQLSWINDRCSNCDVFYSYIDLQKGITASSLWSTFSSSQEGYLDTCDKEAVRRFIDCTHEQYKRAIGDEFGKTVIGVFTDEALISSPFDLGSGVLPWSRNFADKFKQMTGYDIVTKIYHLFYDSKDFESIKIKHDYWSVLSSLFANNYVSQAAEWCEKNNLLLTGHLSGEESSLWNVLQSGNIFNAMSHFHIPGIDSVFSKTQIESDAFNFCGKLVSSVAHYLKRKRVLCETYTGSGWNLSLAEMKRIANRLFILGINMIMLMGGYYSLKGFRKSLPAGYPPSHSYNNPVFSYYKHFSDYVSAISSISSESEPVSNILVMYPTITGWNLVGAFRSNMLVFDNSQNVIGKLDKTLYDTCNLLLKLNYDFEIGFEEMLEGALVKDGELELNSYKYNTIILPGFEFIKEKTAEIFNDFVSQGGNLIMINEVPCEIKDIDGKYSFSWEQENIKHIIHGSQQNTYKGFKKDFEICLSSIEICKSIEIIDGEGVFSSCRKFGNEYLFIITNDNNKPVHIRGLIHLGEALMAYDPNSGMKSNIDWQLTPEGIDFQTELPNYDCIILFAGSSSDIAHMENNMNRGLDIKKDSMKFRKEKMMFKDGWRFRTADSNFMTLDFQFLNDESRNKLLSANKCSIENLSPYSIPASPDSWIAGSKWDFPSGADLSFGSIYIVRSIFHVDEMPSSVMKLITEKMQPQRIFLNNEELTDGRNIVLWDIDNLEYDVTNLLRKGENLLLIIGMVPVWAGPHALPYFGVSGDFSISEDRKIISPIREIKPGSWSEQGYPDYSGTGVYETIFNLDVVPVFAELNIETRDVAKVYVNDIYIGEKVWPSYVFDISTECRQGINKLKVEITNTLANIFSSPESSGLTGPPSLSLYFETCD